jgi:hypothetical protein
MINQLMDSLNFQLIIPFTFVNDIIKNVNERTIPVHHENFKIVCN